MWPRFPTGTQISAVAINDAGEFVGEYNTSSNGYISDGESLFQTLAGFIPTDLNSTGLISGSAGTDAALYDFTSNTTTIFGKLNPTDASARGLGINNAGIVVGESVGTGAFLYNPTKRPAANSFGT